MRVKKNTKTRPPEGLRLGLLGGGQLARMIALAAHPLGIEVHVLSSNADDPAAQVCGHWHQGDPNRAEDLRAFLAGVDLLSFESEFFDMNVLESVRPKTLPVFPETSVMRMIQDRRSQKSFLDAAKIPTAKWLKVETPQQLDLAAQTLSFPFVLKKSQGGYDGYGTFFMKNASDISDFVSSGKFSSGPFIAEKAISFRRELAIMVFRSSSGDFTHYPWVETRQTDSKCDLVLGPIKVKGGDAFLAKIKKALTKINYVGALGIELFENRNGDLLVNELAPRVHNSGHYSQDAVNFSQFQLHTLAGLGAKFPEIKQLGKAFVMANLLGQDENNFIIPWDLSSGKLHWYGKNQSRKGRKLGHLNFVGDNLKSLEQLAVRTRKKIYKP